jgi:hypothetical protein
MIISSMVYSVPLKQKRCPSIARATLYNRVDSKEAKPQDF